MTKTSFTTKALGSLLALTLVTSLATTSVFAKENGNRNKGDNDNEHGVKASMHINAGTSTKLPPGIEKKAGTSFWKNFFLPPGIAKRFGFDVEKPRDNRGTTTATSTPDVKAPKIAELFTFDVGTSTAHVFWVTNEKANATVYFSTTSPVLNGSSTLMVTASELKYTHELGISGLQPNTTYRYVVASADAAGNLATSTEKTFTTRALPVVLDTTAPVLNGVTVTSIGSTTAHVGWITNESATGKVVFGTSTPVTDSNGMIQATGVLSTSHGFDLTGLTASTTYRYYVASTDASGNTASTTEGSFVTTN